MALLNQMRLSNWLPTNPDPWGINPMATQPTGSLQANQPIWGSAGDPNAQYNDWLSSIGITGSRQGGEFTLAEGQDPDQAALAYAGGQNPKMRLGGGGFDSARENFIDRGADLGVDINGQRFLRIGDMSQMAWNDQWKEAAKGVMTYDPTQGWVVPADFAAQAGQESYTGGGENFYLDPLTHAIAPNLWNPNASQESVFSAGPYIAAAGLGAMAAAGVGGGTGAAALGAGEAAGAGAGAAGGSAAYLAPEALGAGTPLGAPAAGGGVVGGGLAANPANYGIGAGLGAANTGAGLGAGTTTGYGLTGTAPITSGAGASVAGGGSALGRLLGLGQTGQDILSVGGAIAPSVLGYLGAQKQQDAYRDMMNQYYGIGAPYRDTLAASYQPGFDLASQPGYGDAFNRMADISARTYSARMGNPAGSPTAQGGILSDVWNQSYLPALANYRGQLGQFGQLGLNTSGAAGLGGAGTAGGEYDAIGLGLSRLMTPQSPYEEAMRRMVEQNAGYRTTT